MNAKWGWPYMYVWSQEIRKLLNVNIFVVSEKTVNFDSESNV